MAFQLGEKLGVYEIVSLLGKGGMGEVWKARDAQLGRDVAIKVSAQQFTDRFEREARAIAALNHPNVCTLYHIGPNYLVMEYIEGPTLAERIEEGPIPLEEALGVAKQIAAALEAAHEKNIVHRDLKPANVKIRPDGSVKVLDFGLAKTAEEVEFGPDSPTMLSNAGMILGTAGYMAPEQARARKDVDKRADIWAFAVVLYEMLTGKRLFAGEDVSDILASIIKEQPNLNDAPPQVLPVLKRCLEKDPKKRLRDIGDWELLLEKTSGTGGPAQTGGSAPLIKTAWVVAGAAIVSSEIHGKYFIQ
jgi:serine/threonine-protein kinase